MVLKADQERVRTLLKDTITLLCRNGLSFQAKFCIDAVIGVTLDDSELFYMSMNEVVRSEKALQIQQRQAEEEEEEEEEEMEPTPSKRPSKAQHRRPHKRRRGTKDAASSADEDNQALSGDDDDYASRVKREEDEASRNDDSNDIVFIKQELDQTWPPDTDQSYYNTTGEVDSSAYQQGTATETSYADHTDLSGVSLVPVGNPQEAGSVWSPGTSGFSGRGRGRGQPHTSTSQPHLDIPTGPNHQTMAADETSCPLTEGEHPHLDINMWDHDNFDGEIASIGNPASNKGRKNRSYTFAFKVEAIRYHKEGHTKEKTARKFGVDSKCIRDWVKNEDKLLEAMKLSSTLATTSKKNKPGVRSNQRCRLEGGGRKSVSQELDNMLLAWIEELHSAKCLVTKTMVQTKALELYRNSNLFYVDKGFMASSGWVHRFFQKYAIAVKNENIKHSSAK